MRVKMRTSMPVTVDGVRTLDLEKGESYEVGDDVADDLIEKGNAEPDESATPTPSRARARGKKAAEPDESATPESKPDEE